MAVTREALEVEVSVKAKDGGQSVRNLGKDVNALTKSVEGASKASSGFGDVMGKMGASVVVLNQGIDLIRRALASVGAVFDATAGKAAKLEAAVAEIKTLLDDSQLATTDFSAEINKLRNQFGGDVTDKAKAFYQAISSGAVDARGSVELLNVANRLAVGGVTNLQTAVDGLTNVMNAYGLTADQATRVSDVLFIGMKAGKTTIGELSRELGDVLTIASSMRVGFDDLVSSVSAVTTAGLRTNLAVTSLRAAIVALSRPTEAMKRTLEGLGITSIQTAIEQQGLVTVLRRIVKASGGSAEAITELFGAIESLPAVTALTGEAVGMKFDEIQRQVAKAAENIGQTTDEAFAKVAASAEFRMGVASARVDVAMTNMGVVILEKVLPALESLSAGFVSAVETISASLDGLKRFFDRVDWERVFVAMIPVITTLAAVMSTQLVAAVSLLAVTIKSAMIPALLGMAKAAAPILLKIVAIAAVFTLAEKVGQSLLIIWDAMKVAMFALVQAFAEVANKIPGLKGKFDDLRDSMIEAGQRAAEDLNISVNTFASRAGVVNTVITEITNGLDAFSKKQEDAATATDKAANAVDNLAKAGKQPGLPIVAHLDEQAIKAAIREYERLADSIAKFGATEDARIKATLKARIDEIAQVEKQLKLAGQLTAARQQTLATARQIADSEATANQVALTQKLLDEVNKVNDSALSGIRTQEEAIAARLDTQLKEIDALRERLRLENRLTEQVDAQLTAAKEAARTGAATELEGIKKADIQRVTGIDLNLSDTFGPMLSKAINGIMTKVLGAISSVVNIVERIITILNIVSSFIDQVFSIPDRLLEALTKFGDSIVRFTAEFLPKLIRMIPDIVDELITTFLEDLPDAALELSQGIIDAIPVLIGRIPELVEKLVKGLITSGPKIMLAMTNALINNIPVITAAVLKMIPELAAAFVNAIFDAIREVGDLFGRLFSGKGFSGMVTRGLEDAASSFAGAVTGVGESLFAVLDSRADARGADVADRIASAIESATSRAIGWLKQFWEGLWKFVASAFQWVVDNILAPLGTFVMNAFQWVVDNVLAPLFNVVTTAFQWVVDNILNPMGSVVMGAFQWVNDNIMAPMADNVSSSFQWVIDNVLTPLAEFVATAFQWVVDNILTPMMDVVSSAFSWVVDNVLDPLAGFVATAFQWVIENVLLKLPEYVALALVEVLNFLTTTLPDLVGDAIRGAWSLLEQGGTWIWNGLKTALDGAITFITSIGGWIWNGLKASFDGAVTFITSLGLLIWNGLKAGFDGAVTFITAIGGWIWDGLKASLSGALGFINGVGGWIWDGFKDLANAGLMGVKGIGSSMFSGFKGAAEMAYVGIKSLGSTLWSGLKSGMTAAASTFQKMGGWILQGILAGIGKVVSAITDGIASALGVGGPNGPRSIGEAFDPTSSRSVVNQIGRAIDPTSWFARGGLVQYAQTGALMRPRGTDVVPAMLTPGEFVISRGAVESLGLGNLHQLNRGRLPSGGGDVNISLDIKTTQPIDEAFVRQKLMPTIKNELRRQSLDGRRILSEAGVRS